MKEIMQNIAKNVEKTINNDDYGFCVLVFHKNKPGIANYVCNCNRKDMIQAMFETAYRLKEWQDRGVKLKNAFDEASKGLEALENNDV